MKILKLIGIILGTIIALFLTVAVFLPKDFTVTRTTEINLPADSVYAIVADYNTFTQWSPWFEMEPTAQITITGEPNTIGHYYAWVGTQTGSGSMTISAKEQGKSMVQKLEFTAPMKAVNDIYWTFEPTTSGGTKVTWTDKGPSDYPVGRYFGVMMDKMLGKDFERGLTKLKELCEKK